jgi:hypothetical protein
LSDDGVAIEVTDADITVTSSAGITDITYSLSGTTSDGMFKIYSDSDFLLRLDGVEITNLDGPAINIQADKTISVELMDETTSTLTDGETYADPPDEEDQKAAFFSEGQMLFSGNGSLVVYGLGDDQHGLGSDDYMNATYGSDVEGDDGSMLTINGGFVAIAQVNSNMVEAPGQQSGRNRCFCVENKPCRAEPSSISRILTATLFYLQ